MNFEKNAVILHDKKKCMGKELSNRIQTSILNAAEKKVLIWLAERQPKWVTSDIRINR